MSEFLKFAYELLSQVVYNIVNWLAGFLKLFITGWVEYFLIFRTYFPTLNIPAKILSVLLMLVLFAVPIVAVVIIVRRVMLHHQLKADKTDNAVLYKEIGRLNKQVLSLIDEKNSILALKVNAMGGTERIPYMGASALTDDVIPTVENVTGNVPVRTVESTASTEAAAEAAAREAAERAAREAAEKAAKEAERQQAAATSNRNNTTSSSSSSSSSAPAATKPSNSSSSTTTSGTNANGGSIVSRAYSQLGKPYVWGAYGPNSFDCSGFVSYCLTGSYTRLGTTLTFMGWTRVSNPQPGDVVTTATHCGIYIGNGQMIHAPHTGDVVKVGPVQSGMIYVRR